jgi:hypothetical protein
VVFSGTINRKRLTITIVNAPQSLISLFYFWCEKEEKENKKLVKMRKPTSQAIKAQVSEELDEQLPDQLSGLVGESTFKTCSTRKRKQKKKKQANKGTTQDNFRNLSLVNVEEVSGLTESGEVEELQVVSGTQPTSNTNSRGRFNVGVRGTNPSRGRGR